jgi:hypothetical protein
VATASSAEGQVLAAKPAKEAEAKVATAEMAAA